MYRSLTIVALALFIEGFAGSCVQINGGAIEVSWVVHANGRAITDCSCSFPKIAAVRIDVTGIHGAIDKLRPCEGRPECTFSCQRQTGATPFDIPETHGDEVYSISLVAVGESGTDLPADEVKAPAPILRTVVRGQPTETDAFLLEAGCAMECEGMNKSGVCARP
jgi:hypothetical protein